MTPRIPGSTGMRRARRGVGTIEFALTMPILLYVTMGITELGMLTGRVELVNRVAREAARAGAGTLEGADPTGTSIEETAIAQATASLEAAGIPCELGCTVTARWTEQSGWMTLDVRVEVPYVPVTNLVPGLPTSTHGDFRTITQQQQVL
jgi:Flp pilus assembly protein TadG